MTYKEYISATLAKFNVSETDVDLILINQRALIANGSDDVEPSIALRAICNELQTIIPVANVSEGGYSLSWNMEGLKMWYSATCAKLGIPSIVIKPKIKAQNNLW